MLVVLEGLEGVGKTTIGKRAAAILGVGYIKSPPEELNPVRAFVENVDTAEATFYFYISGLYMIQDRIATSLREYGCVIVDRYLPSTIAYHDKGRSFTPPRFDSDKLRCPDLLVRVTCDEALRQKRMSSRGLHIYERNAGDEVAIDSYLAAQGGVEIRNNGSLEEGVNCLAALIAGRLSKNHHPL